MEFLYDLIEQIIARIHDSKVHMGRCRIYIINSRTPTWLVVSSYSKATLGQEPPDRLRPRTLPAKKESATAGDSEVGRDAGVSKNKGPSYRC